MLNIHVSIPLETRILLFKHIVQKEQVNAKSILVRNWIFLREFWGFGSGVAENSSLGFYSCTPNKDPPGEKVDKRTLVERISINTRFMWTLELIWFLWCRKNVCATPEIVPPVLLPVALSLITILTEHTYSMEQSSS